MRVLIRSLLLTLLISSSFLEAKPLLASALIYRSQGLRDRQQGRFPEAIAAFQKAVELDPNHLGGRVNLGWTLHLAAQDRSAAAVLQQTLAIDPFHVPASNALGIVYLVNNDLAGAVMVHGWAALLAPNDEIPHYNLGLAFERLKQYDWAITAATKAVELEPDNPHAAVALAIAEWGSGEKTLAQQTYRQAIALDTRYRDRSFLDTLPVAGFSPSQVATAQQVLATAN